MVTSLTFFLRPILDLSLSSGWGEIFSYFYSMNLLPFVENQASGSSFYLNNIFSFNGDAASSQVVLGFSIALWAFWELCCSHRLLDAIF